MPHMKVEKNQDPSISWLPTGTYCGNMAFFNLLYFQKLANLDHFSHERKILRIGRNHIFQVEFL
jgi:hypothetical protein